MVFAAKSILTIVWVVTCLTNSFLQAQIPGNDEKNIREWNELRKLPLNPRKYQILKKFLLEDKGEKAKSNKLQLDIARNNFQIAKNLKIDTLISDACLLLAERMRSEKIDSSIYYAELSYYYTLRSKHLYSQIAILKDLVLYYSEANKFGKAAEYARKCVKLIGKDCRYVRDFYFHLLKYRAYPEFLKKKEYYPFLDTLANTFVRMAVDCGDTLIIGRSYCLLSEVYNVLGDKKRYAETYIKGLQTIESSTQSKLLPPNYYFDAATTFDEFNNYVLATEYYGKFINALWKSVDYNPHSSLINESFITDLINAHLNTMVVYEKTETWDSCLVHAQEALRVSLLYPKEHKYSSISRFYLARILVKLNRPSEALPFIEKFLQSMTEEIKSNPQKLKSYSFITLRGEAYEKLNNITEHKKSYFEALETYKSAKLPSIESSAPFSLVRRSEVLNFFVRSGLKFGYLDNLGNMVDTILEINRYLTKIKLDASQGEALMQYDYESNQKLNQALKIQADLKEKEANTQKLLSIVFFLGLCISGGSGFLAYRKSKETQKANRSLIEKNNLISEQKIQLENAYEELNITIEQVNRQSNEIREKNDKISDSIAYASKIQNAFLPTLSAIKTAFPESFLYFSPRDIVSGDFYWLRRVNDFTFMIVADCTGHGVPGAFMSLVAGNALYQVIVEKQISDPGEILKAVDLIIRSALRQDQNSDSKDGMDIAICIMPQDRSWLEYAGAGRTIYLLRDSEIKELEPDKFPVGGAQHENKSFSTHRIALLPKDRIYMFTDGITDQFGGPIKRKFTPKRLKEFILNYYEYPMEEQGVFFQQIFHDWKNQSNAHSLDDATLFAFEIKNQTI